MLPCSAYRRPCTCSQSECTDSLCAAVRVTLRLSVAPSEPTISTGNRTRSGGASPAPWATVRNARNRGTVHSRHIDPACFQDDATEDPPIMYHESGGCPSCAESGVLDQSGLGDRRTDGKIGIA